MREIMIGGIMDCVYLNCSGKCYCHAQPVREREQTIWYKPTDYELKDLCKDSQKWGSCPRFIAMREYNESIGKSKKEN
jgi:hypothetical protein